jgi:hypothetical protein
MFHKSSGPLTVRRNGEAFALLYQGQEFALQPIGRREELFDSV